MSLKRGVAFSRSHLRDVLLVACLLSAQPTASGYRAGIALFLVGLGLRLWAKGTLRRNARLTTTGPYALCRHPFYAGNFLLDISLCLMAGRPLLALVYAPVFWLVYLPTIRREEAFLRERFGYEFRRYRRRVRAFLPGVPRRWRELRGDWRIAALLREREVSRFVRLLAVPLLILWAGELHRGWWEALELSGLGLAAAALSLHLAGRAIYQLYERRDESRPPRLVAAAGALAAIVVVLTGWAGLRLDRTAALCQVAGRFGAIAVSSPDTLACARSARPGSLLVVADDLLERTTTDERSRFTTVLTVWKDFEAFHLLRAQGAVRPTGRTPALLSQSRTSPLLL